MNAFLVSLTIVSVLLAVGMGLVAAWVLREDRRRSDARVAALEQMASGGASPEPEPDFLSETEPDRAPQIVYLPPPDAAGAFEPEPIQGVSGMFAGAQQQQPSPWRMRLGIAAGVAAVALFVFGAARFASGPPSGSVLAGRPDAAAAAVPPLELVSLSHSQENGAMTISGKVRNPEGSASRPGVIATVFLFGAEGGFLASGRAPLDLAIVRPGEASAFAITIPVTTPVARYRVSFRDGAGGVVSHVDRRGDAAIARNE